MSNHIFLRFSFLLLVDDFGNIRLSGANGEDIFMSPTFSFLSAKFPNRLSQLYKNEDIFPLPHFPATGSGNLKAGDGKMSVL